MTVYICEKVAYHEHRYISLNDVPSIGDAQQFYTQQTIMASSPQMACKRFCGIKLPLFRTLKLEKPRIKRKTAHIYSSDGSICIWVETA